MNRNSFLRYFRYYSKWIFLSAVIGVFSGIASAFFLTVLEKATHLREQNPWLLFLLPVGGLCVGYIYHAFGESVEGGNNLIIDEFHDPKKVIPFRMAPLVLLGTIVTHLFGGSAGREGTAVQMGGSIADQFSHRFKMNGGERRTLLMAGMSGGFGSVFGVPFAGTFFGLEVLAVGGLHLWGFVECAVSGFVAHHTTLALGVQHTAYFHPTSSGLAPLAIPVAILAGIIFGSAARLFAFLADQIKALSKMMVPHLPMRSFFGGGIISILFFVFPLTHRYAGLGVPIIVDSLQAQLPVYDWLGKLFFTALTLGTGFKGGEVTPLLFIGSTLGNVLSQILPLSLPILAAMGFVGVFAGAANTPFACTIMAMELFGPDIAVYAALGCFASYAVSGHHGIYHAQKTDIPLLNVGGLSFKRIHFYMRRPTVEKLNRKEQQ